MCILYTAIYIGTNADAGDDIERVTNLQLNRVNKRQNS